MTDKELTDKELRIKVAELVGWTYKTHTGGSYRSEDPSNWTWHHDVLSQIGCGLGGVPDYPNDLNAMAEIVEGQCAKSPFFRLEFAERLTEIVSGIGDSTAGMALECFEDIVTATARQRAEAFVAVMEKGER